jgi:hypothetical protein
MPQLRLRIQKSRVRVVPGSLFRKTVTDNKSPKAPEANNSQGRLYGSISSENHAACPLDFATAAAPAAGFRSWGMLFRRPARFLSVLA